MHTLRNVRTFDALREPSFRLMWLSTTVQAATMQVENVALVWYILELTGSPFLTGLLTTARLALTILAMYSGVLADRISRKKILLSVQALSIAVSVIMAGLIATGLVRVWHISAAAAITGVGRLFDQPARQALVADSVPTDKIPNAVSLNQLAMNVVSAVAPLFGGILYGALGPVGVYLFMAFAYVLGSACILFVRVQQNLRRAEQKESIWASMAGSLRLARGNGIVVAALIMAAIANLSGFPFNQVLLAVYAKSVLGTDATGLGFLLSGLGVGAIIGAVSVASMASVRRMGRILVLCMFLWHVGILAVALSRQLYLAWGLLVLTGVVQSMSMATIAGLLLATTPGEFRGRIMGLRQLAIYPLPLGTAVTGALVSSLGITTTVLICTVVGSILIWTTVLFIPKLWKPVEPYRSEPAPSATSSVEGTRQARTA